MIAPAVVVTPMPFKKNNGMTTVPVRSVVHERTGFLLQVLLIVVFELPKTLKKTKKLPTAERRAGNQDHVLKLNRTSQSCFQLVLKVSVFCKDNGIVAVKYPENICLLLSLDTTAHLQ